MENNIIADLAALPGMTFQELKEKYRLLFNSDPMSKNRHFLESRLAYRIQVLALGGLKPETEKKLRRLRENHETGAPIKRDGDALTIGTVLVREYKGKDHEVKVINGGFEYDGRTWKSLSAIAKHITGSHWNGKLFFGMRRK